MPTDSTNAARQRRRRESGARPALTGITVPRELRDAMDARAGELNIPTSHLWERAARWFLLNRSVHGVSFVPLVVGVSVCRGSEGGTIVEIDHGAAFPVHVRWSSGRRETMTLLQADELLVRENRHATVK